ncbi:MAG: hypothetical protein V1895_01835 [Parcubacteria group bacterium]
MLIKTLLVEDEPKVVVAILRQFPELCGYVTIVGSIEALDEAMEEKYNFFLTDKDIVGGPTNSRWFQMRGRVMDKRRVVCMSGHFTDTDLDRARECDITTVDKADHGALQAAIKKAFASLQE